MDGKRVFVRAMLMPELRHGRHSRYHRRHFLISDRSIAWLHTPHRQAAITHPITHPITRIPALTYVSILVMAWCCTS